MNVCVYQMLHADLNYLVEMDENADYDDISQHFDFSSNFSVMKSIKFCTQQQWLLPPILLLILCYMMIVKLNQQ